MPAIDPVILELRANLRDYDNKLNATTLRAERSFQQQERAIQKLEFQVASSSGRMAERLDRASLVGSRAMSRLQGIIGVGTAVALARGLLSIADEAKNLEAQLRLATAQTGSFGQATQDVERIARDTRSGLTETAILYGNFIRNAGELRITQDDAARATETFSKSMKISGATAVDSSQGTRQFVQALQSGVLRGDEFNSIMESSPRLARLLADSLGVPIGALRAMAEEGHLTSQKLTNALTDAKFTAGIDAEFKALPVTFDQAIGQLKNAAIVTFGAFDRGGEFSTMIANFVTGGAENFDQMASDAEQLGIDIRATFAGLSDVFDPMVEGARSAFGSVGIEIQSMRDQIAGLFEAFDFVVNIPDMLAKKTASRFKESTGVTLPSWMVDFGTGPVNTKGTFLKGFDASASAGRDKARGRQLANSDPAVGFRRYLSDPKTYDMAGNRLRPLQRAAAGGGGPKKRTVRGPSAETLEKRAESDRLRALRDDQAFENEKASLNNDLLRAKQSIATAADVIAQYELQEIEAQRVRQNEGYQALVAQKKTTQARADELVALNDKVAVERANAVTLREEQRKRTEALAIADADLGNARDIAAAEGGLAETTADRRDSALRLLDLEYQMEKARLDAIVASKESTEAEKEIARRRLAILPKLQAGDRAAAERNTESSYARYRRELPDTLGEVNDRLNDIKVDAMRKLEDSMVSATTKALGLTGALGDIAGQLIRIGIQRKIIGPLADGLFGKADGSSGGLLGGLFSSIAGGSGAGFAPTGAAPSFGQVIGGFFKDFFGGGNPFGRASGGYMAPHSVARVNEGRGGVELLRMGSQGGTVIPLGQANARPSGGSTTVVNQHFNLDARYGITTPELLDYVQQTARSEGTRAGGAAFVASQRNAPGTLAQYNKLEG